jgi:outer membrane lipoprotein SlyB
MQFRTLTLVSALAFLAGVGPVAAAENEGQITMFDRAQNRIMLDDGTVYQLAPSARTSELEVGDRVHLTGGPDGFFYVDETTIVSPAAAPAPHRQTAADVYPNPPGTYTFAPFRRSSPERVSRAEREDEGSGVAVGTVTEFDRAENRITLDNGRQFEIYPGQRPATLQVGSRVRVAWQGYEKGFKQARSVAPL